MQKVGDADVASKVARQLLKARRRMATEVISFINDLFIEFYSPAAVVMCGMVFRGSKYVTALETELTWEELPLFLAVQYIPEVVDAWLALVYLSYLGVDWRALGESFRSNRQLLVCKAAVLCFLYCIVGRYVRSTVY